MVEYSFICFLDKIRWIYLFCEIVFVIKGNKGKIWESFRNLVFFYVFVLSLMFFGVVFLVVRFGCIFFFLVLV